MQHNSVFFNKETFDNINKQKHNIEKRLRGIQHSLEIIDSTRLIYLQQEHQQEYDEIFAQGEIHWYQKARGDWMKLGDLNTKNFHTKIVI